MTDEVNRNTARDGDKQSTGEKRNDGDEVVACVECGKQFVWSQKDQQRFAEKGWARPKRCQDCRDKARAREDI